MSGRLDALSLAGTAVQRASPIPAAPRPATTTGWISSTRSAWAENVPIATGNGEDALLALVNGKFVVLRVPYPTRLLRQRHGWPDRRSEDRLEGQGAVVDLCHARGCPHGRRQRNDEQDRTFSTAPEPSGKLTGTCLRLDLSSEQNLNSGVSAFRQRADNLPALVAECRAALANQVAQYRSRRFLPSSRRHLEILGSSPGFAGVSDPRRACRTQARCRGNR